MYEALLHRNNDNIGLKIERELVQGTEKRKNSIDDIIENKMELRNRAHNNE